MEECAFSKDWLARFKIQHRLRKPLTSRQQKSSDQEAAKECINMFEETLQLEQMYNVDKTSLLVHCLPNKSIVNGHEKVIQGSKLNEG